MTIEWTKTGRKYTDTKAKRDAILAEAAIITWNNFTPGGIEAPMMQGLAFQDMIREAGMGKILALSWDGALYNRYPLLGMHHKFKDCQVKSYWLDDGLSTTCLFTERLDDEQGSGS